MNALLTTAYWPPLHYFYYLLTSETALIEGFENYQKQSYRNRCRILSANGPLMLVIPVKNKGGKELTKDVEIDYRENWQIKHWRAIISAYKNSPYFEYFEPEIRQLYTTKPEKLLEYNNLQLKAIFKILRLQKLPGLTEKYERSHEGLMDLREPIHPKKDFTSDKNVSEVLNKPYYQTFSEKFPFQPDLSILDLLFNTGLETCAYFLRR